MSTRPLANVVQSLRRAVAPRPSPGASDAQLLERFVARRDESAFELLVWRYSRTVLGVCTRLLRDAHEAEDAFQVTFLTLARRAELIRRRESVGGWLHKVACRVARETKARRARRLARERPAQDLSAACGGEPGPCAVAAWRELRQALDEQVGRLPARYREVFVLRCLAGKTTEETARELGCPTGTVESRLTRARERLRAALVRKGFVVPAGLVAAGLARDAAAAGVAPSLVAPVIEAARCIAAGRAVPSGVVPARAAALTEGVCRAMFMTRVQIATAVLLMAAFAAAGVVLRTGPAPAQAPKEKAADAAKPPAKAEAVRVPPGPYLESRIWGLTRVDVEKRTVSLKLLRHLGEDYYGDLSALEPSARPVGKFTLEDFPVAKGARVFVDSKEGGLEDLEKRMRITFRLAPGNGAINRIEATQAGTDVVLKTSDVEKNTITFTVAGKEVTLPLTFDTKISIVGIRQVAELTDLQPGMRLDLWLGMDEGKIVIKRIKAGEGRKPPAPAAP